MIEVNIYLITILHTNLDLTLNMVFYAIVDIFLEENSLEDRLNRRKEKFYRVMWSYALKCGVQSSQRITGHALVPQIKK